MKSKIKSMMLLAFGFTGCGGAEAVAIFPSSQPTWKNGTLAATCFLNYPTQQPLSLQKNLIAENALPDGSVLYSWGYDSFAANFMGSCREESEYATPLPSIYPELRVIERFDFNGLNGNLFTGEWLWETNNPGVALKLYVIINTIGEKNTGYDGVKNTKSTHVSTIFNPIPTGQEIPLKPSFGATGTIEVTMNSILSNAQSRMDIDAHHVLYSVRGELIKIGDIVTGIPLSLSPSATMTYAFYEHNKADDSQPLIIEGPSTVPASVIFGNGGITFVKPACRLKEPVNYSVNMKEWSNTVNLPAYGPIEPIGIDIECNGVVGAVDFSFQDTGMTNLNNKNITLYDKVNGQLIEGLEIEMSHNGERIDIHTRDESPTIYRVNAGAYGDVKTDVSDLSFNSQGKAKFGARFVQRGPIKRNGNFYAGVVVGGVNMFITYN